jgi:ADP-ribose pyrophosphatase YjhB (NUDIX family)
VTIPQRVRAIALMVPRRGDDILVMVGHDATKGVTFYRPLGGGIDFGETAAAAVTRELQEELGTEVADLRYLGTLENIFEYEGQPGHEIVMLFDGRVLDADILAQQGSFHGREVGPDGRVTEFRVVWKPLADFGEGKAILYPNGLLDLLKVARA